MGSITPAAYRYDRPNGDGPYRFLCGQMVLWESALVAMAVAVCPDGSVLRHNHGIPERVRAWFVANTTRYRQVGLPDQLFYVESAEWAVEDLNAIIHDPAFSSPTLVRVLERAGLGMGEGR